MENTRMAELTIFLAILNALEDEYKVRAETIITKEESKALYEEMQLLAGEDDDVMDEKIKETLLSLAGEYKEKLGRV